MAKKAFCEGSTKHLAWGVVIITAAILAGTFFLKTRDTSAATELATVAALPAPDGPHPAGIDGITKATPKGGFKLVGQTQGAPPAAAARAAFSAAPVDNIEELFRNVAAMVKPAVVHIEVVKPDPTVGTTRVESIGSGTIVDRRGYVLTNYHVLEDALGISVTTYSTAGPTDYEGKLVHSDMGTDLGVVKI
ncbi:MAG TPA: hypothetical protein HPP83_09310, partial [Candidatus Hydrogenedentes bacterium]|nr:hypothetical protein [Candidatus Hydrogenedentota bacterium]